MFVKEKCIYLGNIVRTHGIHGQLILASELTVSKEIVKEPILVDIDGGLVPFYLEKEGLKPRDRKSYLIKFDHIHTVQQAEKYLGCETYLLELPKTIKKEVLPTEQTAFLKDYSVYNQMGEFVGKVSYSEDFSGNTLLCLIIDEKETLVPFTEEHLLSWDHQKKQIELLIPEGLLNI